ncbi:hypothetical protein EYF80_054360 [Liparis tanakae]|uniref:Uncharacterized protein n=1 Tax=Liparis tanakae TaxID=230148 RepID=A0A4Z2F2V0_9TELE|nr:hypothetical protein EYF80_054360 [Liparis tanakae]
MMSSSWRGKYVILDPEPPRVHRAQHHLVAERLHCSPAALLSETILRCQVTPPQKAIKEAGAAASHKARRGEGET